MYLTKFKIKLINDEAYAGTIWIGDNPVSSLDDLKLVLENNEYVSLVFEDGFEVLINSSSILMATIDV